MAISGVGQSYYQNNVATTKSWFRCLNRWQKFQGCFGNAGKREAQSTLIFLRRR